MADERTPLLGTPHPHHKRSQLRSQAAVTLGASLLGTGILAQPKACESTGLLMFVALSLAALSLSHMTAMMLCKTSTFLSGSGASAPTSYSDIVAVVLGRRGELFTMWSIAVMQIGCCVGYIVVIGDVFTPLIRHWTHATTQPNSTQVIFISATVVLVPLCVGVRRLASLRYTSAIAMFVIMLFGGVVVGNGMYVLSSADPDEKRKDLIGQDVGDLDGPYLLPRDTSVLRAIPLISFAYFMHFNVLPVFKTMSELGAEAEETYSSASKISFLLSGTVTCAFGIFGYLTFLNVIESDILTNFRVTDSYISSFLNVVRALYGVGLLLAFPVVMWEARENLKTIIFGGDKKKSQTSSGSYSPVGVEEFTLLDETTSSYDERVQVAGEPSVALKDSFKVHAALSIALVYLTATLGAVVTNLEVVFGLIGSTCSPLIAYILPSLLYLQSGAAAKDGNEFQPKMALVIGSALIPLGVTVWVLTRLDIM